MTTDKHLARIVGWTVCILAAFSVLSLCWQVTHEHKVDPDLHDLVVLLAGGLLGRLTTSRQPEATDSPVPTTVVNAPSDPVPTTVDPAGAMPDPMGADPGPLPVIDQEAGHSELLLLLVIITGVFVGGFLLHLALT